MRDESTADSLHALLDEFRRAIGAAHVETAPEALTQATATTYAVERRIRAILRPGTTAEVQECVRIAVRARQPLYTVSSGLNWGYGSGSPVLEDQVLVHLGRLNEIDQLDEEMGTVRIGAGVTQGQLAKFLSEKAGGRLWMDSTASSVESSVIGHLSERGHGVTPYADHAVCASDYDVVLGNGELVHTGFRAFTAPTQLVDHWGLGPSLEGLFTESNLGIVTAATLWLLPAPEHTCVVFFTCKDDAAVQRAIDNLRPLRLDGTLRFGPFLANVYRSLSRVMRYPWDRMQGETPLPIDKAYEIAAEHKLAAWVGAFGIYGTRAQVAAHKKLVKRALRKETIDLVFLTERLLKWTTWVPHPRLQMARKLFPSFQGAPTGRGLGTTYWRDRRPPHEDMHLDKDRCGFMLLAIATPYRGKDVVALNNIALEVCMRHKLEPSLGVAAVRDRSIHNSIAISFDRSVPGEDERALKCQDELVDALAKAGYFPHRLSTATMHAMERIEPSTAAVLRSLKATFDPAGVLSPGRYEVPPPK
jgi:4-cresol dehydrogenase (hydroxylating) flavoprotein subunit